MTVYEWLSFLPLGAVILFFAFSLRHPRLGMTAPTQLWLQDCVLSVLAYAAYMWSINQDDNFKFEALRAVVMVVAGLIASAELFRETFVFAAPLRRAVVVSTFLALFLWLGGLAILSWWFLRSVVSLSQLQSENRVHLDQSITSRGFFLCATIYAVSFLLSTRISLSTGITGVFSSHEMAGWEAYMASFTGTFRAVWKSDMDFDIPWTANTFFWISASMLVERRSGVSAVCAFLAIACGASFYIDPDKEILKFCPAYHLWLTSMAVLLVVAIYAYVRRGVQRTKKL